MWARYSTRSELRRLFFSNGEPRVLLPITCSRSLFATLTRCYRSYWSPATSLARRRSVSGYGFRHNSTHGHAWPFHSQPSVRSSKSF